ncbi:hypothetical protein [uncultured Megasphaera sp.]|nr:hypothetical protein [uncultured Megasphaera sp.]
MKQEKKYPIINVKIYVGFTGFNARTACEEEEEEEASPEGQRENTTE